MQPSSTYHQFAVGMTGGKMSSSQPETTIFLNDSMKSIEKKIKSSFSGGQATVEEHRAKGGDPEVYKKWEESNKAFITKKEL